MWKRGVGGKIKHRSGATSNKIFPDYRKVYLDKSILSKFVLKR